MKPDLVHLSKGIAERSKRHGAESLKMFEEAQKAIAETHRLLSETEFMRASYEGTKE